jgi:hypothetical protein
MLADFIAALLAMTALAIALISFGYICFTIYEFLDDEFNDRE